MKDLPEELLKEPIDIAKIQRYIREEIRRRKLDEKPMPPLEVPIISKISISETLPLDEPSQRLKILENALKNINDKYSIISDSESPDTLKELLRGINEKYFIRPDEQIPVGRSLIGKVKGKLVRFLLNTFYEHIKDLINRQNSFNAEVVQLLNKSIPSSLGAVFRQREFNADLVTYCQQVMPCVQHKVSEEARRLTKDYQALVVEKYNLLTDLVQNLNQMLKLRTDTLLSQMEARIEALSQGWRELGEWLTNLENQAKAHNQWLHNLQKDRDFLFKEGEKRHSDLIRSFQIHQRKLDHILSLVRAGFKKEWKELEEIEKLQHSLRDFTYLRFEEEFRGSSELIQQRQQDYVPYFKGCKKVLDVGCGRGEFLLLLKEYGIAAYGIDINEEMVEICRAKGLEAEKGDALSHLASLPDVSLDGIFSAQFIEHLTIDNLVEFFELSFKKLRKDSVFIAETVNPLSLYALIRSFFADPTHQKPVHPYAVSFLLKSAGFSQVEIKFINPVPANEQLEFLSESSIEPEQIARINENIRKLNDLIFAPQDFALIAIK